MTMYGTGLPTMLVLAGVVDGDDRGVVQRGGGLRLAAEPGLERRVPRQVGAQHLDRDGAAQPGVAAEVHLGHAATAEQLADLVAAAQLLRDCGAHAQSALLPSVALAGASPSCLRGRRARLRGLLRDDVERDRGARLQRPRRASRPSRYRQRPRPRTGRPSTRRPRPTSSSRTSRDRPAEVVARRDVDLGRRGRLRGGLAARPGRGAHRVGARRTAPARGPARRRRPAPGRTAASAAPGRRRAAGTPGRCRCSAAHDHGRLVAARVRQSPDPTQPQQQPPRRAAGHVSGSAVRAAARTPSARSASASPPSAPALAGRAAGSLASIRITRSRTGAGRSVRQGGRHLADLGQRDAHRGVAVERPAAGEALVGHHAERVDVAGRAHRLPGRLLRRDVVGRAHDGAGLGQRDRVRSPGRCRSR